MNRLLTILFLLFSLTAFGQIKIDEETGFCKHYKPSFD